MTPKTYILIRHGETLWNTQLRLMGVTDVPLTKTGKLQVKALATYLDSYPIDVIYSSPLKRAATTATAIHTYHKDSQIILSDLLKERAFGTLEGLSYEVVNKKHPALVYTETWKYTHFQPPGGERLIDVQKRAEKFVQIVRSVSFKTIAVVSHGVFLKVLYATLFSLPLDSMSVHYLENTSITMISVGKDGAMHPHFFNNTPHLEKFKE